MSIPGTTQAVIRAVLDGLAADGRPHFWVDIAGCGLASERPSATQSASFRRSVRAMESHGEVETAVAVLPAPYWPAVDRYGLSHDLRAAPERGRLFLRRVQSAEDLATAERMHALYEQRREELRSSNRELRAVAREWLDWYRTGPEGRPGFYPDVVVRARAVPEGARPRVLLAGDRSPSTH